MYTNEDFTSSKIWPKLINKSNDDNASTLNSYSSEATTSQFTEDNRGPAVKIFKNR